MKRAILPPWCKEVKKALIDKDMYTSTLAKNLGFSRQYISNVVNGIIYAPEIAQQISEYLEITVPYNIF